MVMVGNINWAHFISKFKLLLKWEEKLPDVWRALHVLQDAGQLEDTMRVLTYEGIVAIR